MAFMHDPNDEDNKTCGGFVPQHERFHLHQKIPYVQRKAPAGTADYAVAKVKLKVVLNGLARAQARNRGFK
jgi:hypothetical protein